MVEVVSGMTEQIEHSLTQIFRDVFDDDNIALRPDLSAKDVDAWDSLTHIRLILTVEREFHIKFTVTEVGELKNVGELVALIRAKASKSPTKN
jgi:acyl carrier protein